MLGCLTADPGITSVVTLNTNAMIPANLKVLHSLGSINKNNHGTFYKTLFPFKPSGLMLSL